MEHVRLGARVHLVRPGGVVGTVVGMGHIRSTNGERLMEFFVVDIGGSRWIEGLEGQLTVSKIAAYPDTIFPCEEKEKEDSDG